MAGCSMDSAHFLTFWLSPVVNYLHYYYSPLLLLKISFPVVHYLILIILVNYHYDNPLHTQSSKTLEIYLAVKNHDALVNMVVLHCWGGVKSSKGWGSPASNITVTILTFATVLSIQFNYFYWQINEKHIKIKKLQLPNNLMILYIYIYVEESVNGSPMEVKQL
jgi:hypothetical protein